MKDFDSSLTREIEVFLIDSVESEHWDCPESLFDKLCKKFTGRIDYESWKNLEDSILERGAVA